MKVLILGATGMLGHRLVQELSRRHDVTGTVRGDAEAARSCWPPLRDVNMLGEVSAESLGSVAAAIRQIGPEAVVNCIGIVKQLAEAKDPIASISVNALFPHQLARLCESAGARLIHLSTDCVFSGRAGRPYCEDDVPDPIDLYGRSKLLGEVSSAGCLTLRTSIVGRELRNRSGLVEWFLSQRGGSARGYAGALYTGLTTPELSGWIVKLLESFPQLQGVWQVASEPICKYDLLNLLNRALNLNVTIERDDSFACDRRLNGSRFREATGLVAPGWAEMVAKLALESSAYER